MSPATASLTRLGQQQSGLAPRRPRSRPPRFQRPQAPPSEPIEAPPQSSGNDGGGGSDNGNLVIIIIGAVAGVIVLMAVVFVRQRAQNQNETRRLPPVAPANNPAFDDPQYATMTYEEVGNVAPSRAQALQYVKKRATGSTGTGTATYAAPDPDQMHKYDSAKANRALADYSLPPTPQYNTVAFGSDQYAELSAHSTYSTTASDA